MNILKQLEEDLKQAAKQRDQLRLQTIRLLKAALKNYEIEVGHMLSPSQMLSVLRREANKRRDSIKAYSQGKRSDLVKAEKQELEVIESYLPPQMSEAEIEKMVDQAIADLGAQDSSLMGQVIGWVMKKSEGRADGAIVSPIVREKLSR